MVVLFSDTVNDVYRKHLDWYPAITPPSQPPQRISGLKGVVEQFDLILLDSYGVLCRGVTPIEEAVEAIAMLREKAIPFCVVSNDTMTNQSIAAEKYQQRGFDFQSHEVLTSLDITEQYIHSIHQPETVGVIAPMEHPSHQLLEPMVNLNHLNGMVPDVVDTLLFLTGAGWTMKMQVNLVDSANGRQFKLIAGNPDVGASNGSNIVATPGYFLANLVEETCQRSKPKLFGKPGAAIFEQALQRYEGIDPSRVLMVGDTLYTDILGGNAMGFKTLLLECGIYQGKDITKEIEQAGISPDFIAPNL